VLALFCTPHSVPSDSSLVLTVIRYSVSLIRSLFPACFLATNSFISSSRICTPQKQLSTRKRKGSPGTRPTTSVRLEDETHRQTPDHIAIMSTEAPAAATQAAPAPVPAAAAPPADAPGPQLPPQSSQFVQYPASYGQQFQPYQQYPRWSTLQQQIPHGAQIIQPPPVIETKQWVMSKLALHSVGFIFALVVLALGITFVNDWSFSAIMLIMNTTLVCLAPPNIDHRLILTPLPVCHLPPLERRRAHHPRYPHL
jgi:hypothetical protein